MDRLPLDRFEPIPAPLRFRVTFSDDDVATLHLSGDLDNANADELSSVLDAVETAGLVRVDVDGHDIGFIDCGGLTVLERHAARLATRGGSLTIVRPSRALSRIVELTGTYYAFGWR
jgi:anti-sigma B factor antagonist